MRRSKYRNLRTNCGAHVHQSKKEAVRCVDLQFLEKDKLIRDLVQQPRFDLVVNKKKICTYVSDFGYWEWDMGAWVHVPAEDAKGVKTAVYKIKKKLMKAIYNIEVRET